jgi:LysM repeat protein
MFPLRFLLPLVLVLAIAAPASASSPHVVAPGETLWSIATSNNFTTRALAVYNHLDPDANVILGTTIKIPTLTVAQAALAAAGNDGPPYPANDGSPPPALGAYTVRAGDTLSGLAAKGGVTVAALAEMNGVEPDSHLITGTAIKVPVGSSLAAEHSPNPTRAVQSASPAATPTRVTASEIAAIANRNGVPASLATAIAWQESGFSNAMISAANARGVMQIMPGTWDFVQDNLALRRLDPTSALDNVGAGVLYLGHLLRETGGDQALAIAGYYQGLASVRRIGLLAETRQYVANVVALQSRFG